MFNTHQQIADALAAADVASCQRCMDISVQYIAERDAARKAIQDQCGAIGHVVLPFLAHKKCAVCGLSFEKLPAADEPLTATELLAARAAAAAASLVVRAPAVAGLEPGPAGLDSGCTQSGPSVDRAG